MISVYRYVTPLSTTIKAHEVQYVYALCILIIYIPLCMSYSDHLYSVLVFVIASLCGKCVSFLISSVALGAIFQNLNVFYFSVCFSFDPNHYLRGLVIRCVRLGHSSRGFLSSVKSNV